MLAGERAPMVLAAVEHLSPLWRKANTYPHLVDQTLPGNPESLPPDQLHARIWPMIEPLFLFVRYLLPTNSGEILVMFPASVLALPAPLLPVQILWINLVTDGLPAIALGLEPAERVTMRRRPRSPTESIFARGLWQHALWVGLTMAIVCPRWCSSVVSTRHVGSCA